MVLILIKTFIWKEQIHTLYSYNNNNNNNNNSNLITCIPLFTYADQYSALMNLKKNVFKNTIK